MMQNLAPLARFVLPRQLLVKGEHHHDGMYKHGAGYYLLNGRWHKLKDKAAPKGASQAAHKHAAGQFAPAKHFTDEQWQQLQLPAENTNAASFNKLLSNLQTMSEAGDVTGILGMGIGTNTYGKKLATIANHLLGLHGTEHKVAPGQKAGTHAAVQAAPAEPAAPAAPAEAAAPAEPPAPAPEPAPAPAAEQTATAHPVSITMPVFAEGKTKAGVKAYYEKAAAKVLAAAGDAAALEAMKADGLKPNAKGKVGNTWAGKTANSKLLLEMHAQLLAQANGAQAAPAAEAAPAAVAEPAKPPRMVLPKHVAAPAAAPAPAAAAPASKLDQIPWDGQLLPEANTNAKSHNAQVAKIKAMALAGDTAGLQAYVDAKAGAKQTYAKKQHLLAQTALAALKEGGAPTSTAAAAPAGAPAPAAAVEAPAAAANPLDTFKEKVNATKSATEAKELFEQYVADGGDAGAALSHMHDIGWHSLVDHLKSETESGPKDGDTKPAADGGTLVFKDGRWHKQASAEQKAKEAADAMSLDELQAIQDAEGLPELSKKIIKEKIAELQAAAAPAAQHPIDAVPMPNLSGLGSPQTAQKALELLKQQVKEQGPSALAGVTKKMKSTGALFTTLPHPAYPNKKYKIKGYVGSDGSPHNAVFNYVEALKEAAGKAPKPAAPKVAAAPTAAPAAAPEAPAIEAIDTWQQTGPQGGSNPGGRFKDAEGVEWYCKFPADESIAKSEVLAAKLYGAAGVAGQDAKLITKNGKIGIASRWVTVKKAGSPAELAKVQGAQSGFAVDAWLGNWDVVGLGYDNLQVGADGKAVRVDAGGSLEYRAQGSKKPFGAKVDEIDTLRDAKVNAQSASVFGKMSTADITASVAKVAGIEDSQIRALVEEFGPGDKAARKALADTLIARKADLLARYPKAGKAPKKRLDPTKLPVTPAQLPKPHDFANWHSAGHGLSSKAHINAANTAVEQQAHDVAMQGNLVALKEFKYHGLDKETGNAVGEAIPIAKHPSKHVVQYHADLVQALDEIANPPEPLKVFKETEVGTLASLQAAFPPKPFGTTVASVKSNEKMGFWVALGAVAGAAKFAPKKTSNYSTAAIAAAKAKFADAKKLAKHFISSVQASGSYNDLFRDGKTHDHQGNALTDVAQAALEHATEMPEGTSIYRWQTMSDQMLKHIMSAADGTVFQATGPMCTSYDPTSTKGFGKHRIVIRYAKGAKAVESFASGKFQGEKEVTTLPNNRFIILSKKMVPDVEHGNPSGQRAEIEVLMLPPDLGIPGVKG